LDWQDEITMINIVSQAYMLKAKSSGGIKYWWSN
jgi:hypothetical protein